MTDSGPIEQARSVLAEITERLRAPHPQNIEHALSLTHASRELLLDACGHDGGSFGKELSRTMQDLGRLAEQSAAFYLGLSAVLASRVSTYDSGGEARVPIRCRSLSVDA